MCTPGQSMGCQTQQQRSAFQRADLPARPMSAYVFARNTYMLWHTLWRNLAYFFL